MTERKWMPSEYQDEVVPSARPSPNDWITKLDDGAAALAAPFPEGDDDEAERALKNGDVVDFDWTESYGRRELTFHRSDDGWTWELHGDEPTASEGGSLYVAEVANWESVMLGLTEFAEAYTDIGVDDGDTITILFFAWSLHSTRFEFRDGTFHEAAEAADA